jgi:hypothetical protein
MVAEVVDHARFASAAWVKLGFSGRKRVLLAWSTYIINNVDQIAALVSLETGKPISDAKLEASLAASHIGWAARHAEDIMRTSYRAPGALMANMSATVARSPLGVVGVIAFTAYVVYVQIENYVVTPRIMKRTLSVPGAVTIIAALIGSSLLGLVGGLLAVPVAASIILILDEVVIPRANNS